jgi:hypothetical protein
VSLDEAQPFLNSLGMEIISAFAILSILTGDTFRSPRSIPRCRFDPDRKWGIPSSHLDSEKRLDQYVRSSFDVDRCRMNQGTASMHRRKKRKGFQVDRSSSKDRDARRFSIQLSSPTEGRPACFWAHGSTPDRIIEFWPGKEQMGRTHRYSFDVIRKYVVYDRVRPEIRAVLLVDRAREKDGEVIQPILGRRLEWDGPQAKAEIKKALDLVDEIARIERRGRPRGKGHKKRKFQLPVDPDQKHFYDVMQDYDFTKMEMKVLHVYLRHTGHQARTAAELGVTPQAVNKGIKLIEAKLQAINPRFSLRSYQKLPERTITGQRRSGRLIETDESGTPYVRDVNQEIERRR